MNEPCAECGRLNRYSPSDYFCSDICQQHWHAKRSLGAMPDQLAAHPWRAATNHLRGE